MRALFLPPTYQDSAESGRLILRDGSTAFIRLSEPADLGAMREFFYQLSPESRKRRFFSSAKPSEALLARQCDSSNPRSQLTLIVSRIVEGTSRIIATGSYAARDETTAEVAFAVDDEFQGKGLGGLLLERLALLAARHGLVPFWALTRVENELMLETFRRSGFPLHSKVEDECVEIDFSVAPSEDSVSRSEMRDRVFTTASLRPFFKPRSVAFIGASRDASSLGYRNLDALVAGGYLGPVYAVNPNATHVRSLPAYPSARQIPSGADLAIVAVPRDAVLPVVDDCAVAGVRALVVITAGFAEADEQGHALQEKLLERVRGHGMRMIGPNSMGLVNADPDVRLNASLSPGLPPHGSVAMASQSGALGLAMLALARQRHVGVSTFVSVGNKADISGNDLLQYWQGDEATRVILLYLESFGNPRRFARIAKSVSRSKPIVAVKAGGREAQGFPADFGRCPGGCALPPDGRHPGGDAGRDVRPRRRARTAAPSAGTPRRDPLGRWRPRRPLRLRVSSSAAVGASALGFDEGAPRGLSPSLDDDRQSPGAVFRLVGGPVRASHRDTAPRFRGGCPDRDPYAPRCERFRRDAGGDPAGHRGGARGRRRRQAGRRLSGGEGRLRRAARARRRKHPHVRVPGVCRAGAREGGGLRGVARGTARDHSRLRRHRPCLRPRDLWE